MRTDIVKRVDNSFVLYAWMDDKTAHSWVSYDGKTEYVKRWIPVGTFKNAKEASIASKKYQ